MSHILTNIQSAWDLAKPFQIEDAEFAARNHSSVLGHKTGLGKTFIAQLAWSKWNGANKALILGTLASCSVWARLLRKWSGVNPVFIQGKTDPNWALALQAKEGVFMCTYMSFLYLMKTVIRGKPRFDVLIDDELHRVMRTRNEIWKAQKRLDFDHFLGLSATWASRGPQDLFPVLNLVNHKTFSSYWRFVSTWCYVEDSSWGKQIFGVRNEQNLRKLLWDSYYRARTWPEVGWQFKKDGQPGLTSEPVIRRAEYVPMSKQQQKILDDLERDMMASVGDDMIITSNSLVLLTRRLQVAISPKMLMPSADYGGPVDWLINKIGDDPHTVVFCPFREGLDVIKQALIDDKYPPEKIFMLRGGMKPDEITKTIARWKAVKGVALVTTAFAQSFELDTTDNAYSLGFLWDPNDNEQAEGRLRRLDSILQTPCNLTYIVPEHSDYNEVIAVLDGKIADTRDYLFGFKKNYADRKIKLKDIPYAPGEDPNERT